MSWACGIALGSVLLGGCVAVRPLGEMALDANRVAHEAATEQTMLNILRARDRLPMAFTSFTVMRGNFQLSGSAGLGATLPEGGLSETLNAARAVTGGTRTRAVETVTPSLSAGVMTNPNFEVAVYDSKQFQSGIQTPVTASLIEYYLQTGYPPELLTALMVSRVDLTYTPEGSGALPTVSIVNDPREATFGRFVRTTRLLPRLSAGEDHPLFAVAQLGSAISLAAIDKLDGRSFDIVGGNVVRKRGAQRSIDFSGLEQFVEAEWELFSPGSVSVTQIARGEAADAVGAAGQTGEPEGDAEGEATEATYTVSVEGRPGAGRGTGDLAVEIFFRSPEAMLYHLGAYVRCAFGEPEGCAPYPIEVAEAGDAGGCGAPKQTRLIAVGRGFDPDALISVQHRNRTYTLPEPDYACGAPDHRGSQALVIVQQLINLQKSADSLPTTSSVTLVP